MIKMKENKKDLIMILLWMIIGGIFGFSSIKFIDSIKSFSLLNEGLSQFSNHFIRNILWYQLGTAILLLGPTFYWMRKSKGLLATTEFGTDEEADSFDQIFDKLLYRSLLLSNVYFVVGFVLFGIAIDKRNPFFWASLIVFLMFSFIGNSVDVKVVRYIQKQDPLKKGNPTSIKFGKEWFDGCDEAERMMIYKAAYQTFAFMQNVLIGIFVITFFSKTMFNTGNYPIFLMGGVWLIHSLTYFYYAAKSSTTK